MTAPPLVATMNRAMESPVQYQFSVYIIPLYITAAIAAALAIYCIRYRKATGAIILSYFSIAIVIWSVGYALELSAIDLATKKFWGKCQYFGIVMAPVCWAAFAFEHTGHHQYLSRRNLLLGLIIPVVTIVFAFTTEKHSLIWHTITLDQSESVPLLRLTYGYWFWINLFYSYILMLLGSVVVLWGLIRAPGLYRKQGVALLVALIAPWLGNALYLLDLNPFSPLDLTPFAFTISLIALTLGVLRFHLIDLFPVARDTVMENMNIGMLVIDKQERLVDINRVARKMLFLGETNVIGQHAGETLAPWPELSRLRYDGAPEERETMMEIDAAQQKIEVSVSPLYDKSGSDAGRVIILQDITERLRTKEALHESELKHRAMLNAIPDLMFVHDRDGVVLDYHAPTPDSLFAPPKVFLGKSLAEILPEEISSGIKEVCNLVFSTHQPQLFEYQLPIRGQLRSFEARIVPYTGNKVLSIIRDISDNKVLEMQLQQAQKMEAIGRLTGGIAHDFNNLLQVINGYTELAASELTDENPAREYLSMVKDAGSRASSLVSQLLLFGRRQIMRPDILDLSTVVSDLLKMLYRIIGEQIQLHWHPGKGAGTIFADRSMVEQAIMNLCVNSRDAMPDGGDLTIETHDRVIDKDFCAGHPESKPGRYTLLRVSDTGCGIDAETLGHIFEPFFTSKPQEKGTGLGLASVYGIIKQHGGFVVAASEVNRGTCIELYWPVREGSIKKDTHEPSHSVKRGTETILLAEDDKQVRRFAKRTLENAGYTVYPAETGEQAITVFKEHVSDIDLLILDVIMPQMGGRRVYDQIREHSPQIKALFISGYGQNAIHTNFVLDDKLSLLQKPFSQDVLLHSIRDTLDKNSCKNT